MSVQLVLCVGDSVWRAAGHLARVHLARVRMPTAHLHRAPAHMVLLLLAVLSFHCRRAETAAGAGTGVLQLVLCVADFVWRAAGHLWLGRDRNWCWRGCAAVADSADD